MVFFAPKYINSFSKYKIHMNHSVKKSTSRHFDGTFFSGQLMAKKKSGKNCKTQSFDGFLLTF